MGFHANTDAVEEHLMDKQDYWRDRIETLRERINYLRTEKLLVPSECKVLGAHVDDIEDAYMKLPIDAEGVPIRPGDEVRIDPHSPTRYEVLAVGDGIVVLDNTFIRSADECTHVKPRTLEEILDEWRHRVFVADGDYQIALDEYAAEIRELLGGDA